MAFISMRAAPPSRRHLRHWERVCRYLDAQPYRAVSLPLPAAPPMSVRLFKRMARFRLVRHRDDCRWQLSPRWRAILLRLWDRLPPEEPAHEAAEPEHIGRLPFIVDSGVDTLYVNLRVRDGLPAALVDRCDALKALAQTEDQTIETPWLVFGAPLSMYKAGVGTRMKGRGVSWSYILRKSPLSGLVGSARLSAECLWTYSARGALDRLRDDLALVWASAEPGSFRHVSWQLSQIHLCADVANFAPNPTDLSRLLTRSRKRAIHIPSLYDVESTVAGNLEDIAAASFDDAWLTEAAPPAWDGVPLDLLDLASLGSPFSEHGDDATDDGADEEEDGDDRVAYADEAGASVHLWGRRVSGFAFSPGGDLSAVWYDKLLEERVSGKRWMEAVHAAGGWQVGIPLTRIEARFRRGVLRELAQQNIAPDTMPVRWFDDPWESLDHLHVLWAFFAGLPPEADIAPDVTYQGWMRLVVADVADANRSRWRTDPVWELVQRARFQPDASPEALTRLPRLCHDLVQVDAELYGLLKLRAVLRGEYLETTATLSQELRSFADDMDEEDAKRGRDFAEEVREKARMLGKPVPIRSDTVSLTSITTVGGELC